MSPETSSTGNLDQQAVSLAKAIRQVESGGNPSAKGKSGEHGAYQFTSPTWLKLARDAGVTTPLEQSSLQEQNKVAYTAIKKWKDAGYNPGQIASMWNAGEGEPNAYQGKFADGSPSVGTNKYGVKYDVPTYARNVASAYQGLKSTGVVPPGLTTPSTVQPNQPEQPKEGFLSSLVKGIASPVVTMAARPFQAAAELMGASPEQVDVASQNIPLIGGMIAPVPQDIEGFKKDVGRGIQTAALAMPVGTVGQAAAMGAVSGLGTGLERTGGLSAGDVALGAGAGLVGGGLSKALETYLPNRIVSESFQGLGEPELQKMLAEKQIGSMQSLLKQSTVAVRKGRMAIDAELQKAMQEGAQGAGDFAVRATLTQFPEYAGREATMLTKIKNLIPSTFDVGLETGKASRGEIISYIDKIFNGTATLAEKDIVRSAIDSATTGGYSKMARALQPSAGHDLAMTFAGALRNEVQQSAPKTAPLFQELAKEVRLQKVLKKMTTKGRKISPSWREILPFLLGSAGGGPLGGLAAATAWRAATSPGTEFALAKGVRGVGRALSPALRRGGLIEPIVNK